jgi:hypothetical protein
VSGSTGWRASRWTWWPHHHHVYQIIYIIIIITIIIIIIIIIMIEDLIRGVMYVRFHRLAGFSLDLMATAAISSIRFDYYKKASSIMMMMIMMMMMVMMV